MAEINLISEKVAVFPIAKERAKGILETRLFTEHNVSGIIRQLLPKACPGFIESTTVSEDKKEANIKFNLYGYQFDIDIDLADNSSPLANLASARTIYAYIQIDELTNEINFADEEGKYRGLTLTDTNPIAKGYPCMELFKITATRSIETFNNNSFLGYLIGGIDGKYK